MGASAIFWRTFLGPKAEIHVLTYDRVQAMAWMKQNPGIVDKMFTGDQGDLEVLGRVISEGGANYDIMVDDGSHRSVHQIIAVKTFFPRLKSGAKMFIEDVHVYNDPSYRAHNEESIYSFAADLMEDQLKLAVKYPGTNGSLKYPELSTSIGSVDVMREMIILTRYVDSSWDKVFGPCVGTSECGCGGHGGCVR